MAHRFRTIRSALILFILFPVACTTSADSGNGKDGKRFPETFERGSKHSYAGGDVPLASGGWRLENALVGKTPADVKHGAAALRIEGGGSVTMRFSIHAEAPVVTFRYACYGKDGPTPVSLWYATDNGTQWQQAGRPVMASPSSLATASFPIAVNGSIRFSIHNDGSHRVNVDDFDVLMNTGVLVKDTMHSDAARNSDAATRDDNMALGNPSNATPDEANRDNYLLTHPQYTLSYNNDKGMANWVSWHLSTAWRGDAARCNCFFSDNALPGSYYKALTSAYIATGFDRGHLCPSEDRTSSADDNAATFLMSNMSPQAPLLNQQPWERLESYARTLSAQGYELYIIAGGYGQGGSGAKGGTTATIAGGKINVPAHFWKILLVLPVGGDDVHRISKATRVIAVDIPNVQSANAQDWSYYRTSIKSIEQATGYHFLDKVPAEISAVLKDKVDAGPPE